MIILNKISNKMRPFKLKQIAELIPKEMTILTTNKNMNKLNSHLSITKKQTSTTYLKLQITLQIKARLNLTSKVTSKINNKNSIR